MSQQEPPLTAGNIRYLLVLSELEQGKTGIKSRDVAERLGISKVSVHTMLQRLCEKGFVQKEKYGAVQLTDYGRSRACRYAEQYALLYDRIHPVLNLPQEACQRAVCAILAQLDEHLRD